MLLVREKLEDAANVRGVRCAVFVDYLAKYEDLAWPEDVGGGPVECSPVNAETKIALSLRRESADGGTVEGQVVKAPQQELLVIVEHVQPALKVAEHYSQSLNALFIRQVLQAIFTNLVGRDAIPALLLCLQVEFLEFVVGQCQEIAQFCRHGCGSVSFDVGTRFRANSGHADRDS